MPKSALLAILTNVLAHGWSLLVLLTSGKVLFGAVFVAESDAIVMVVLNAIALVTTLWFAFSTWYTRSPDAPRSVEPAGL